MAVGHTQEDVMFAIAAAAIFGLALILDFADVAQTDAFNSGTLTIAGLFCIAMHLAGFGTAVRTGGTSTRSRAGWRR